MLFNKWYKLVKNLTLMDIAHRFWTENDSYLPERLGIWRLSVEDKCESNCQQLITVSLIQNQIATISGGIHYFLSKAIHSGFWKLTQRNIKIDWTALKCKTTTYKLQTNLDLLKYVDKTNISLFPSYSKRGTSIF